MNDVVARIGRFDIVYEEKLEKKVAALEKEIEEIEKRYWRGDH